MGDGRTVSGQIGNGTWKVRVAGNVVAWAWQAPGSASKTYATGASTRPWPFPNDHAYELTSANNADQAAFLAWCCAQLPSGSKLLTTVYTVSVADGSHTCT